MPYRRRAAARSRSAANPVGRPPSHTGSATRAPQRRFAKPVAALLATLIVLFLVGAGGYLASRQLYFIGTNSQGIVTIYRGLPVRPAGRHPPV